MRRASPLPAALAVVLALLAALPAVAQSKKDLEKLAPRHRQWLEEVRLLIPPVERKEFLKLETDYQRDAFIRRFWEARDPYPDSARNEFREEWYARREHVEDTYGNFDEDRARILLLQGRPDGAFEFDCTQVLWPLELWVYDRPAGVPGPIHLIFYQQYGSGRYRLWRGIRYGIASLFAEPQCGSDAARSDPRVDLDIRCAINVIRRRCVENRDQTEAVVAALTAASITDSLADYAVILRRLELPPPPRQDEWLATFRAYSTDLPEDAATFEATPSVEFPRKDGGRMAVRVELAVPAEAVEAVELEGRRSYDFSLTGEVLRGDELFESFRYRFDAPEEEDAGTLSLRFQRLLRPGTFRMVLKLEDLHGGGFWRREIDLVVPEVPDAIEPAPAAAAADAPLAGWLGGSGDAFEPARVELFGPAEGLVTGMTRFDAKVVGAVARVTFFLDGRQVMSKARPPYSLELDLGPIPRPHVVRAVALDAEGRRVGVDELDLNAGEHRFAIRLLSPRSGEAHVGPTEVRVELAVPEGERFDRLELFAGERPAATLYQEPFLHTLDLPAGPVYVRAVAYLEDGASREAVAFVNVTDPIEEIQVKLVELYAAVLDGAGRPATDLDRGDFRVVEDGVEQEVVRFERVTDRPVHVVLMIDSSASMAERIDAVRQAAAGFLHRILTPKDRAAVVAFSDRAGQDVEFTDRPDDLTIELAALQAERGTALWDNLISVLYHLNGVQGQRAVLLLSDGQDRSSGFSFAEVREFARSAGVAIYPIGIELSAGALLTRRELTLLASESGGRSFFIGGVDELDRVYAAIESELRSKYLLVYQSTGSGSGYREVRVEVPGGGLEVKTLRGYYP
jgi:Ca-activated chloride channel family protein